MYVPTHIGVVVSFTLEPLGPSLDLLPPAGSQGGGGGSIAPRQTLGVIGAATAKLLQQQLLQSAGFSNSSSTDASAILANKYFASAVALTRHFLAVGYTDGTGAVGR